MYVQTAYQETFTPFLASLLSNFKSEQDIETASNIKAESVLKDKMRYKSFSIFIMPFICKDDKIIGKTKPISLNVIFEDGYFFVENELLNLFGEGKTREESINTFVTHLNYFYHYYKSLDKKDLGGEGLKLKNIYETIIRDV